MTSLVAGFGIAVPCLPHHPDSQQIGGRAAALKNHLLVNPVF